ncbi:MAG: antibiotic biosynthesis monooxygenase [Desulfobacterales bacterium]|nr:antibiotic biosynthesis monooxygenase [Desulfobacterales bacterium]
MIVVAKIKAKSGQAAEMEKTLQEMVAKVGKEAGTLVYTLHRSQKDPSIFMFYEKYTDMDAFAFHGSTPYFKELMKTTAPMMDGAPQIDTYDEVVGLKR